YTKERLRRVTFTVPVDIFNDLDRVEKLITDTMAAHPLVLKDPTPSTVVAELQEYAVVLKARAYVRSPDYWQAIYGLRKDVQRALRQADVLIAVNRQAPVIRNEAASAITAPPAQDHAQDRESPLPQPGPRPPAAWQKTGLNA
ncbi:MAG TPA: hypothetical protein VG798_06125, partial [Rhizomicrobium sp.]|nr:hypothetical protein [Rhizomicrobium sp.]